MILLEEEGKLQEFYNNSGNLYQTSSMFYINFIFLKCKN